MNYPFDTSLATSRIGQELLRETNAELDMITWEPGGIVTTGPTYNGWYSGFSSYSDGQVEEPRPEFTWVENQAGQRFDRDGDVWVGPDGSRSAFADLLAAEGRLTTPLVRPVRESEPEPVIVIDQGDVKIVAKAIRQQYGRSISHIGTPKEIATGKVEALVEADRIGDTDPVSDDWVPSIDDVEEFASAGVGAMVRLWRASEITHYALIGLARAGRLLPREATDD